jgi:hypothetical protein
MNYALGPYRFMDDRRQTRRPPTGGRNVAQPGWAKGLRKLYNSVVDEPLPESFDDLLKKLDGQDHGK